MARGSQEAPPSLDISNVIAAFSEEQVARITRLTKGRLRYWAKTRFFAPSYADEDHRLSYSRFYSYKDVVALRTLEMLRVQNDVPLQHLRKVAETLSHLKDSLWTETTLFVFRRKVHIVNAETGKPEEVETGQYLLGIPLKKVMEDTSADIIDFASRQNSQIGHVSRNRAVCRNAWVIAGTRIPVDAIKRLHEDGFDTTAIIAEYPDLTPEDITAALSHRGAKAA